MFNALLIVLLCASCIASNSKEPDCGTRNQFKGYCFSFEYCTDYLCNSVRCGYFIRTSTILKIHQARIIPKCAVTKSTTLKHIVGINSYIEVLASGAFASLPNLESIILPFNQIKELRDGTFYNVTVSLLDLSANKILYISEGAFDGITGLKYLNLSKNELSTLPVEDLPMSLVQINLSRNFLTRLALNGAKRPNLTSIDLSYNNLRNVAFSFDNPLERMDLTHNQLQDIDFYDINDCENLRIPLNLFTYFPQFLEYSKIRRLAMHPNPWKCDELRRLWTHLQNNYIEVEKSEESDTQPVCSINTNEMLSRITSNSDLECSNDNHCADNLLCRAYKCWNPCEFACHPSSMCQVTNHEVQCVCPGTQKRNPREIFSACYDVECFTSADCSSDTSCMYSNHTCVATTYGGYLVPLSSLPWWFDVIPKTKPTNALGTGDSSTTKY